MISLSAGLTVVAAAAAVVSAAPLAPRASCATGVHMIVARGSNEAAGEGVLSQVVSLIQAAVPGSDSVAVDYPAAIVSSSSIYPLSVAEGISDTLDKIHSYVAACGAASRIVLLGYSQGGNVITDALAGGILKPTPLAASYHQYSKSTHSTYMCAPPCQGIWFTKSY
jgi:acetylxylan esterase